jgi:hypothetical protein
MPAIRLWPTQSIFLSSSRGAPTNCSLDIVVLRIANKPESEDIRMTGDSAPGASGRSSALLAIAVGGAIAGALDLAQACILFGWKNPLVIAAGLLGPPALQGEVGTYALGAALHFFNRLLGSGRKSFLNFLSIRTRSRSGWEFQPSSSSCFPTCSRFIWT